MNGTDLKKIIPALFVVLLVCIALQARVMVSTHKQLYSLPIGTKLYNIVPTPNFVELDDVFLQTSIEICSQSYPQRSDFKKTFSLISNLLFQIDAYPTSGSDCILKNGVLPSTPFYISYCNLLI